MISFYSLNKLQSEKQKIQILKKQFKFSKNHQNPQPKRLTKKNTKQKGLYKETINYSMYPSKKKLAELIKTHVSAITLT